MPAVASKAAAGMTTTGRTRRGCRIRGGCWIRRVHGARRAHRDGGAAAVEMALVLPLLLFILFGVIDFGRMLNAQITLTEAAREGARAAVLAQPNDAASQRRAAGARVQVATSGLSGVATALPTACPAGNPSSANAVVSATMNFSFVTPLSALAPLFGGDTGESVTLTGKGVMPCVG